MISGTEKTIQKKQLDKLVRYDYYLASLLMVSFFMPIRLQVFMVMPVCVYWVLRDVITYRDSFRYRLLPAATLTGSLYLLYLAWLPFTPAADLPHLYPLLEQKVALLLVPFVFALIRPQTRQLILSRMPVFVVTCFAVAFFGNLLYLIQYGFYTGVSHPVYRNYFEEVTSVHPTYMGLYLCFSLCWLLLHTQWQASLRRWMVTVVYTLLLLFLFALMPKAPVLALLLVLIHYVWMHRKTKVRIMPVLIALTVALTVALLFIPAASQRVGELAFFLGHDTRIAVTENSVSMRQLIWAANTYLLQGNWLTGLGPAQLISVQEVLFFSYSMEAELFIPAHNTHNEYINQWLSFGIAGLLLFLVVLGVQLILALRRKDYQYLYLLILLLITFGTENVLSRQHGVLFYAFFTSLFFFRNQMRAIPSGKAGNG